MTGERFLVSARKYRPQTFSELVSQEHVAETLRNALLLDRVAHAYLFCGPRGVGKTSAARILAKAINCETPPDQRSKMDPCRTCTSCESFEQGRSLNVIEIDAASNNGVDDIRALREAVRIPPPSGKKKVYIIDEVHMLSKQAFNALLKTLEEPPPFIQFIFATTEPHKLLPTVQSRCQRFDFRRISVPEIVDRLRSICEEEDIEADEASLRLIARKGDGALRDAFSAFDQAVILGGKKLVYDEMVEALGAVNIDTYFETSELIANRDRAGLLNLVERLAAGGTDFDEFLSGLTDHLRDLLIAVTTKSTELIEADQGTLTRYDERAKAFSEPDLLRHLIIVNEGQEAMKRAVKPRLRLELTLLKMASLESAADLQALLRALESIPDEDHRPAPSPGGRTKGRHAEPEVQAVSQDKPLPAEDQDDALHSEATVETTKPKPAPVASIDDASPESSMSEAPKPSESPAPRSGPVRSLFGAPALKSVRPKRTEPQGADQDDAGTGTQTGDTVEITSLEFAWAEYVKDVASQRIHVGALLQHTKPTTVRGSTVEIAVPDEFHERLLGREAAYLAERLCNVLSIDDELSMRFFVSKEVSITAEENEVDPLERVKKLRQENPIIRALFDEFGGELVW